RVSSMPNGTNFVDQHSAADAKIKLFRSLFRGRDDVYPRRFESRKTGRSGYAPACGNQWVRGICEKPRIKCADCRHQRFLPMTDEVIRWHLSGFDPAGQPFVAGIYPMLQDETCFFLAVDFDKEGWREDAGAFLETCRAIGIPAVLERSRSGQGGHVWLFFAEAVTAASARRLGSFVLTETMERRPDLGFGSYDRFFPNQDTLPHGGFGNLIALPLQKQPRDLGNSVFLDDEMVSLRRSVVVSVIGAEDWQKHDGRPRAGCRAERTCRRRTPATDGGRRSGTVDGAAFAPPKRTADCWRASWSLGARRRERDLHREGRPASGTAEPIAPPGGLSKS